MSYRIGCLLYFLLFGKWSSQVLGSWRTFTHSMINWDKSALDSIRLSANMREESNKKERTSMRSVIMQAEENHFYTQSTHIKK